MTKVLTQRQQEVLTLIGDFQSQQGRAPTRREIADHFGFSSANSAQNHIEALVRKGFVRQTKGVARGLILKIDSGCCPNCGAPVKSEEAA